MTTKRERYLSPELIEREGPMTTGYVHCLRCEWIGLSFWPYRSDPVCGICESPEAAYACEPDV